MGILIIYSYQYIFFSSDCFSNFRFWSCHIPYINSKNTIKYKIKNELYNLKRENTYLTQTPQAFKFKRLYELAINEKNEITDEATLFIDKNRKIKFIKGDFLLLKTFLIYIIALVGISFLQSLLFETVYNSIILNISNIIYFTIIIVLSIATWNSARNIMGLYYYCSISAKIFSSIMIIICVSMLIKEITRI